MSGAMLHGLGDCTPDRHCGCLVPTIPTIPALTVVTIPEEWFEVPQGGGYLPHEAARRIRDTVAANYGLTAEEADLLPVTWHRASRLHPDRPHRVVVGPMCVARTTLPAHRRVTVLPRFP